MQIRNAEVKQCKLGKGYVKINNKTKNTMQAIEEIKAETEKV